MPYRCAPYLGATMANAASCQRRLGDVRSPGLSRSPGCCFYDRVFLAGQRDLHPAGTPGRLPCPPPALPADAGLAAVAGSVRHSVVLPARGFYFVTAFVLPPAASRAGGLPGAMSRCQFTYGPRPVQT